MDRAVCIHAHIYQPPRENPWLGDVEVQRSALPYHDWNERVTAECYRPNTTARILDSDGMIAEIVNTYGRISFTAAPTLLAWIERHRPEVYRSILDADREGQDRFSGHGTAIAQAYNHLIMPLANSMDKRTQVRWGIADFESRFGRRPEGMWLPETAVDVESLDLMAEAGIKFTILAPHQAAKVRAIGAKTWKTLSDGSVDTTVPYLCRLPSGRNIVLFFYDASVAHEVAFGNLLEDGQRFAARMLGAFKKGQRRDRLAHIATDGETYGHHRKFGEMALAYALRAIETGSDARLTVYGEYLEDHPPGHEAAIVESSSWSCVHGVERWRRDDGCRIGAEPEWTQGWREPLRRAVEQVRDALAPRFEEAMAEYVGDPWLVRDGYIDLVLDRSKENAARFLERHASRGLDPQEQRRFLMLLEMQRQSMMMQTSCGWFFDEISEPGSVQVMRHAARAMELAKAVLGIDLEETFVDILRSAPSNLERYESGADVYRNEVRPAAMDLQRIGAQIALYRLFGLTSLAESSGTCTADGTFTERADAGGWRGHAGRVRITSRVTQKTAEIDAVALIAGVDRIAVGVRDAAGEEAFRDAWHEAESAARNSGDPAGAVRRSFPRVLGAEDLNDEEVMSIAVAAGAEAVPRLVSSICDLSGDAAPIARHYKDLQMGIPRIFALLEEHAYNTRLLALLEQDPFDPDGFTRLAGEMQSANLQPDLVALSQAASRLINRLMKAAAANQDDPAPLSRVADVIGSGKVLLLPLSLWESQNICIGLRSRYGEMRARADSGDADAEVWIDAFRRAARCLQVRVA
jgi:alpha-amylase/alpha-mannosidase (GH57 family)